MLGIHAPLLPSICRFRRGPARRVLLDGAEFCFLPVAASTPEDLALRRQFAGGRPVCQHITRYLTGGRGEVAAVAVGKAGCLNLHFSRPVFWSSAMPRSVHGADEDHAVADGSNAAATLPANRTFLVPLIELLPVAPERLAGFSIQRGDLVSRRDRVDERRR